MTQNSLVLRLIGIGLFLIYGISFFVYLPWYSSQENQGYTIGLLFTFGILSIASIGWILYKPWGRVGLLIGNIFLGLYSLGFYLISNKFVDFRYSIFSGIIIMYLLNKKAKSDFHRLSRDNWRSVLIIDDDEMFIRIVRPILMENGFSLIYANRGEEGIEIAKSQKPDLILLDVILPGLKGRDVCRRLKLDPQTKDIPVIFTTAKDSLDDIQAEMAVGATAHLTKPINAQSLINTIRGVLK